MYSEAAPSDEAGRTPYLPPRPVEGQLVQEFASRALECRLFEALLVIRERAGAAFVPLRAA